MTRILSLAVLASLPLLACTPNGDAAISAKGFSDNFNRKELGDMWNNTGGGYSVRNNQLHIRGARNKPLWLKRKLPRNVRIEFDVTSDSTDGDIKVEVFGDGKSKAESLEYTATSYVVIFGGWHNSLNVIARMNEHGHDRAEGPKFPVVTGHRYHIRIERKGSVISAWADEHLLASMDDSDPLEGRGHDHFAFNNWQSDLTLDNLKITPL